MQEAPTFIPASGSPIQPIEQPQHWAVMHHLLLEQVKDAESAINESLKCASLSEAQRIPALISLTILTGNITELLHDLQQLDPRNPGSRFYRSEINGPAADKGQAKPAIAPACPFCQRQEMGA